MKAKVGDKITFRLPVDIYERNDWLAGTVVEVFPDPQLYWTDQDYCISDADIIEVGNNAVPF